MCSQISSEQEDDDGMAETTLNTFTSLNSSVATYTGKVGCKDITSSNGSYIIYFTFRGNKN